MSEQWLNDANILYGLLTEQLVSETGAFSKGVNKGINIARSALRNPQINPPIIPEALSIVQELRAKLARYEQAERRLSYDTRESLC